MRKVLHKLTWITKFAYLTFLSNDLAHLQTVSPDIHYKPHRDLDSALIFEIITQENVLFPGNKMTRLFGLTRAGDYFCGRKSVHVIG